MLNEESARARRRLREALKVLVDGGMSTSGAGVRRFALICRPPNKSASWWQASKAEAGRYCDFDTRKRSTR